MILPGALLLRAALAPSGQRRALLWPGPVLSISGEGLDSLPQPRGVGAPRPRTPSSTRTQRAGNSGPWSLTGPRCKPTGAPSPVKASMPRPERTDRRAGPADHRGGDARDRARGPAAPSSVGPAQAERAALVDRPHATTSPAWLPSPTTRQDHA